MTYSDQLVLPALKRLMQSKKFVTYSDLSEALDMPLMTVRRAVIRLRDAGIVTVVQGGRGIGYQYEFTDVDED